jgi:hypothetical protein
MPYDTENDCFTCPDRKKISYTGNETEVNRNGFASTKGRDLYKQRGHDVETCFSDSHNKRGTNRTTPLVRFVPKSYYPIQAAVQNQSLIESFFIAHPDKAYLIRFRPEYF